MSAAAIPSDNPFLIWLLHLHGRRPIDIRPFGSAGGYDVILEPDGSKRFGLGIMDGLPALGYVEHDRAAIESVRWTSAAILFAKNERDWVALSATDARPTNMTAMNPIPMRLFIPVSTGRLAAWKELAPKEISIAPITKQGKGAPAFPETPFRKLPLKVG